MDVITLPLERPATEALWRCPKFGELDNLSAQGEAALDPVRARLEKEPSAEVRDRLTKFIERHTKPATDPERLRQSRTLELLEHLGTPEAKALLAKLAAGGPARLTTEAAAAAKRLAARQ